MCGILGFVGLITEQMDGRFPAALDLLSHRGPDDRGLYRGPNIRFGHQRLAILDLSRAGRQPMVDDESGAVIVFNGEIYNYIELRKDLETHGHRFRSRSDTEVLLKTVLQWGPQGLERLNGMWAFAVWFPRTQTLFFSRDRFGVKPFYYAITSTGLCFASEPKALLCLEPMLRDVNQEALSNFLTFGNENTFQSFYSRIALVPPAHFGEYHPHSNKLSLVRYWKYPEDRLGFQNADQDASGFAALLDDAVRLRLRSDVPVGVSLSGGLDSTAILAASMKEADYERTCFTSVYGPHGKGEAGWAGLAARVYDIEPIAVNSGGDKWLDTLEAITWHMDAPCSSPAVYPVWCLMAAARERGIPVLLDGQGADEALGGYSQHAALDLRMRLGRLLRHPSSEYLRAATMAWTGVRQTFAPWPTPILLAKELTPLLRDWNRKWLGAGGVLRPEIRSRVGKGQPPRWIAPKPAGMDPLTTQLWRDHSRDILPGLLAYGDAMSSAHAIELRQPFMDFRLVEWLFARPAEAKIARGETKWLIRSYLRSNGQKRIASRPDKVGYVTPAEDWLAADNGLIAKEWLLAPGSRIQEYCEPKRIARLISLHQHGVRIVGKHLYRLLSTEIWLRECIGQRRSSDALVPALGQGSTDAMGQPIGSEVPAQHARAQGSQLCICSSRCDCRC